MAQEHDNHTHSHGASDREETIAALRFMIDHNSHHITELLDLAHSLGHLGKPEQAEEVERAIKDFEAGNVRLQTVFTELGNVAQA
ncbi:MAG: hypothetical protein FWD72_05590 [Eggerthellaceae bacterium]|nr:hypothetical protein [Eggerthellaceae bacterium]